MVLCGTYSADPISTLRSAGVEQPNRLSGGIHGALCENPDRKIFSVRRAGIADVK